MKNQLQKLVQEIVKEKFDADIVPQISVPTDLTHGDFTTNVAFILAKELSRPVKEIAQEIVSVILERKDSYINTIEVAVAGFINFSVSEEGYHQKLSDVVKNSSFAKASDDRDEIVGLEKGEAKKVMVEFTDPNPFKELHIGHLYSNSVGESLARLLEIKGNDVWRVCYQGDVGMHVAKALLGIQEAKKQHLMPEEEVYLKEKAQFLGKSYAWGARAFDSSDEAKQEVIAINKKVYSREDPLLNDLYDKGKKWSMEYFASVWQRLGMKFNRFYLESEVAPVGLELVKQHIADGTFEEHEGAVVLRGEKFGLHTRVFINSQGLPTYEAKELGLAPTKYKDFPYDESIILTGNEINEYFKVLLQALRLVEPDLAVKTHHLSHGMVRLPEGKMSSREGNVVTAESVLDEAHSRAATKIAETKHLSNGEESEDRIAEQVAIGAVKYAFLKSAVGKDIEFDLEQSVSFEGNSGPYIQYTYVRTQSILEKANVNNQSSMTNDQKGKFPVSGDSIASLQNDPSAALRVNSLREFNQDELMLARQLYHFSDVVEQAARELAPHVICTYLFDLAQTFNNFYQKYRILINDQQPITNNQEGDSQEITSLRQAHSDLIGAQGKLDRNDTEFPQPNRDSMGFDEEKNSQKTLVADPLRLLLTAATGVIIRQGLGLLGIEAPQKM